MAIVWRAWLIVLLTSIFTCPSSVRGDCVVACKSLGKQLPGKVFLPATPQFILQQKYWSLRQEQLSPACRVAPTNAKDVSRIVKTLRREDCSFAVKGGGHTAFAGGSSIQDGLAIDFSNMASISNSMDSKSIDVGPGARWINVYQYLDPKKLTAIGARVSDVGVGGATLGGGISYFSARYGFGCDNVEEYEVVLASGEITRASPDQNKDLFFALRGGGSTNFGIITNFKLAVYKQEKLWGGTETYSIGLNETILKAFTEYAVQNGKDDNAHLILPFVWAKEVGWVSLTIVCYALPIPDPPVYNAFEAIPSLSSTMRITNVSDLALEGADAGNGQRQLFRTLTVRNDATLSTRLLALCHDKLSPLQPKVSLITCVFQAFPTTYMRGWRKNGGNALGLEPRDGPLVNLLINLAWADASADEAVNRAAAESVDEAVRLAEKMRLDHPFIYMNYAGPDQNVQAGFGRENLRKLKNIRDKYDRDGFFRDHWPGYHKLP